MWSFFPERLMLDSKVGYIDISFIRFCREKRMIISYEQKYLSTSNTIHEHFTFHLQYKEGKEGE